MKGAVVSDINVIRDVMRCVKSVSSHLVQLHFSATLLHNMMSCLLPKCQEQIRIHEKLQVCTANKAADDTCSTFHYSATTKTRKPRVRWRFSGGPPLRLADRKPLAQLNQPPPRYTRSSPVAGPPGLSVGDFA